MLLIAPCVRWVKKIIGNWKAHKERNGESWRFATAPPAAGTLDVKAKFRNAYTKTPASMFAQVARDAMDRAKDERERKAKQSDEDRWAELATRLHLETAEENGSSVYGEYLAFQKQMRELPQFVMRIRTEAAFLCPTLHPEFVMPMASPTTCRADVTGDSAAICRFLAFSDFRAVFFLVARALPARRRRGHRVLPRGALPPTTTATPTSRRWSSASRRTRRARTRLRLLPPSW